VQLLAVEVQELECGTEKRHWSWCKVQTKVQNKKGFSEFYQLVTGFLDFLMLSSNLKDLGFRMSTHGIVLLAASANRCLSREQQADQQELAASFETGVLCMMRVLTKVVELNRSCVVWPVSPGVCASCSVGWDPGGSARGRDIPESPTTRQVAGTWRSLLPLPPISPWGGQAAARRAGGQATVVAGRPYSSYLRLLAVSVFSGHAERTTAALKISSVIDASVDEILHPPSTTSLQLLRH
jgi:hypothetical protein